MRLISDDAIAIITIFQEAEGESLQGKVAVAEVIRRRMARRYSSDGTVVGTCLRPYQFSGWNTASGNRIRSLRIDLDEAMVADCVTAWAHSRTSNIVPDAVLYYNPDIVPTPPAWADPARLVAVVEHHRFYKAEGL